MITSHRCADNPRLLEVSPNPIPPAILHRINPTARRDPSRLAELSRLWPCFCEAIEGLADVEDDGIPIEDFAPVYAMFRQLLRGGIPFADSFIVRMEELNREAGGSTEDGDDDIDVADFENHDPNDDHFDELYVDEGYDDACEGYDDAFEGDDSELTDDELNIDEHHEQHHARCVHNYPDTPEPTGLIHIGKDVKISRINDTIRLRRAAVPVRQTQRSHSNRAPEPIRLKRRQQAPERR